jgi:hypothetical protein
MPSVEHISLFIFHCCEIVTAVTLLVITVHHLVDEILKIVSKF